jgi:hypothetical protein
MATASAIPLEHDHDHDLLDDLSSPVPRSVLDKRDSYDCKGSSMCSSLQVSACDNAVNSKLIRNDVVNYGASGYVVQKSPPFCWTFMILTADIST